MEDQGRESPIQEIQKNKRQLTKLKLKKENINQILIEKRMSQAYQMELSQPIEIEAPEEKEVIKVVEREDLATKTYPSIVITKRKDRKNVGPVKAPITSKRDAPTYAVFFCHKKDHIKKVCFFKKPMEQIKLMENLKKKKEHKKKLKREED